MRTLRAFPWHLAALVLVAVGISANRPCSASPACAPIPAGLVAWWRLEGNGLDFLNTYNGTVVGGSFEPAEVGQGYRPAGLGSLVQVPDAPALNATTFTIDCWAKIDPLPPDNVALVWKGNVAGADKSSPFGLGVYGTAEIPAFAALPFVTIGHGDVSQEVRGTIVVPLGTFFHLAATADGTTLSLYLNGQLAAFAPQQFVPVASTFPLQLGGVPNPGAINTLTGVLDEVELHDVAATAAQILAIYEAGSAGKCVVTGVRVGSWGRLRRSYR